MCRCRRTCSSAVRRVEGNARVSVSQSYAKVAVDIPRRVASCAKPACNCSMSHSRRERVAAASMPRLSRGKDEEKEYEVEKARTSSASSISVDNRLGSMVLIGTCLSGSSAYDMGVNVRDTCCTADKTCAKLNLFLRGGPIRQKQIQSHHKESRGLSF
jgi:hypothetical protein